MTHSDNFGKLPADLPQYIASIERELILETLDAVRWNRTRAARELGLTFRAMRYKLSKLGIEENGAGARKLPPGFNKLWPRLREAAFNAYGRKCSACGAMAKHGAKMHVDHIKPMSRFPEIALDLSNLQILCENCNLIKGDKYGIASGV